MRVTVPGLGHMGRAFAARAIESGQRVTVWNRSPGKATDPVASGAIEADSHAEAASSAGVVLVGSTRAAP